MIPAWYAAVAERIYEDIVDEYERTKEALLQISGYEALLSHSPCFILYLEQAVGLTSLPSYNSSLVINNIDN